MPEMTYPQAMSALKTAIENELRVEMTRKIRELADEYADSSVPAGDSLSNLAMMIEMGQI